MDDIDLLCLNKMQNPEEQFAENAAVLTYVFNKVEHESFKNLLTNEIIQMKSLNELKNYYMGIAKEHLKIGNKLPDLPTLKNHRKPYTERAFTLAKLSKNTSLNKFVNPITLQVMTTPEKNKQIKAIIEREIANYFTNKNSLPKLYNSDDEWNTFCRKKIIQTANELAEKSISPPSKRVKAIPPTNHIVTKINDNEDEFMEHVNNDNSIRQTLAPKISSDSKLYDIIKMRDYIRIVRRLWMLAQLLDGKKKEIMHVRLDPSNYQIIHPYLENIDLNLYKRISANMGINNIRKLKTVEQML